MKTAPTSRFAGAPAPSNRRGFTLTEIMVSTSLFSLVVMGMIYSHIIGLRMFNITATKLSACQSARAALNSVRDEVRSSKLFYVGSGGPDGFTNVAMGNQHIGNAVFLKADADATNYVLYFVATNSSTSSLALKRFDSSTGRQQVIAPYITNMMAFAAEDYGANVLTSDVNNRILRMTLDFYQWEFPVARVGAYYDYYRLQTRIARRTIE